MIYVSRSTHHLDGGLVALGDSVPVDELLQEGRHVGRARVLHVEVIGVLPHIHRQHGGLTRDHGQLRVGGLHDFQRPTVDHQPGPPGPELGGAGRLELGDELVVGPERLVDRLGELSGGLTAAVGLHALPEEGVVPDLEDDGRGKNLISFGSGTSGASGT